MPGKGWYFNPARGGRHIPLVVQERTRKRILMLAGKRSGKKSTKVEVSFRGKFCYIDAYQKPLPPSRRLLTALGETKAQYLERMQSTPRHLCRLRYFLDDRWSLAIYAYSHERYEIAVFPNGHFVGTPEAAFGLCMETLL
jgi:hypothetical protein